MKLIIPIILILISVVTFFAYIDPMYIGNKKDKGIKELLKEKQSLDQQNIQINKIKKKRKELLEEYKVLTANSGDALQRLSRMVPDNVENARLVNYLYNIKQQSNIGPISDIKIITDDPNQNNRGKIVIKEEKNYKSINISFRFNSNYKNFVKFISDMYKSLRIVDIVSIKVNSLKNRNDEFQNDNLEYTIVIRTYWLNTTK